MKAIERHRQTWQGKSDEWLCVSAVIELLTLKF